MQKMSYQYRNSHYIDKTVLKLCYLYNRNPHSWIDGHDILTRPRMQGLRVSYHYIPRHFCAHTLDSSTVANDDIPKVQSINIKINQPLVGLGPTGTVSE